MNVFRKLSICAVICFFTSSSALAEIVNTDWLEDGDGRAFTDVESGLTFLDLTETLNMSVADVKALLDSTYFGWSLASAEQVVSLFSNLLADTVGYDTTTNYPIIYTGVDERVEWAEIIGGTGKGTSYYFQAFVADTDVSIYGARLADTYTREYYNYGSYAETDVSGTGTWLVLDSSTSYLIEVQAPFVLSSLALLGLGLTRRKKPLKL